MDRLFSLDAWLSQTVGHPCYRYVPKDADGTAAGDLAAVMAELSGDGQAFFYAKLETPRIAAVTTLERSGFSVVDTNVTLEWSERQPRPGGVGGIQVLAAEQTHFGALQDIAVRCFRYSRFHLDPLFPDETADLLKRKWVENYCLGARGSVLYAATVGEVPAGFLAVIETADGVASAAIDLVGVAPEFQGRGVGTALVSHFLGQWQGRVDRLLVGTQVANVRSMAFYEQLGFRTAGSAYVLHAHFRDGVSLQ